MKRLKKIGAVLTAVAMISTMSISALAAGNVLVDDTETNIDRVQITGATAEYTDTMYEVTLNYEIEGAEAGDQITMLAYVFGDANAPEGGAETNDANAQEDNYITMLEGKTRALDQQDALAEGTLTFKLAKGDGTGISINAQNTPYMLVKLGSDATGVKSAQAFFINLSLSTEKGSSSDVEDPATYTITFVADNGKEETATSTAKEDEEFTLPSCAFAAPDGKVFKAWKIGDTEYPAGAKYTFTDDTEVTAVWMEKSQGGEDSTTVILGDVDNDKVVGDSDWQLILWHLNEVLTTNDLNDANSNAYKAADVDGQNGVDDSDWQAILWHLNEVLTNSALGNPVSK